jgi:two-component system cell cycle response regulator DivK
MPRILLVEDNEMNRDMLTRRLRKRGYEVLIATTGLEGLEMARAERPDLVLMDMSLPELDGWEVTRRLRADPETRTLRIIALTAHAMEGDRQRTIAAGCDEYETKPVDIERLGTKMAALLDARRPEGT